jgi:hypothetical protein
MRLVHSPQWAEQHEGGLMLARMRLAAALGALVMAAMVV